MSQELPSWLIPASKSAIIQANKAVNQGNNNFGDIDDDEDDKLSNDFDWYISPTDKSIYEKFMIPNVIHLVESNILV